MPRRLPMMRELELQFQRELNDAGRFARLHNRLCLRRRDGGAADLSKYA